MDTMGIQWQTDACYCDSRKINLQRLFETGGRKRYKRMYAYAQLGIYMIVYHDLAKNSNKRRTFITESAMMMAEAKFPMSGHKYTGCVMREVFYSPLQQHDISSLTTTL